MNLNFNAKDFVHLHLHSDYSLLQSAIQLKPLTKRLKELEMKACAITDFGNMYGAISFYNSMKAEGIRPILGYEAFVTFDSRLNKDSHVKAGERPYYNLVLLAKDLEGYQNLVYLASKAFTEGFHHRPRIDLEILAEKSKGLVGLSSGFNGAIWHFLKQNNFERAFENAKLFDEIFGAGNFFIEIQDHGLEEEKNIQKELAAFSTKSNIPLVATNEPYYLTQEDARAHEILLAIGEGKTVNDSTRTIFESSDFYVRSAEEMWRIFGSEHADALRNTLRISEMCDVRFNEDANLFLPNYPFPKNAGFRTDDEYFERIAQEGFASRKQNIWQPLIEGGKLKYSLADYEERLRTEIETIKNMKFSSYFLIVWDFIRYAKEREIPVGPGRGSAAGSLVAYCLEITDVDPLEYDLLFERFLNPERISMPDIDIDFCVRGRADVINHVTELYGRESVCQIITFGTMASRAALKDVGRALNMPYGDVERIAKLIPPPVRGRNVSISKALEQVPDLKQAVETDKTVKELVDLALRLEGCSRHSSVHAAGVVISPKPLHELVPVALSNKNELTSQYAMNDLEKAGMLKMDFLALTTLTVINDCLKSLKLKAEIEIDWNKIPANDPTTMKLFGEGRTEAIFQFESRGMQEICRRLKPKELEDLSALNALYRPGPIDGGMIDDFIARHRGEKPVEYIVPEMEYILQNTFGILVYQEQIMQLAQKLAGYTLGEADMMRRAMGKKKREEMAEHEERFISGAIANKIKRSKAVEIFKLMAQFADYGFNRSHSVAYAYLAFQTAYLKAHYPAYFYAAVLSNDSDDAAKIYKYSNELRAIGLKLLPPDINYSDPGFTPSDNAVRFGLNAIKGIGSASVQAIIRARKKGNFTSLFDFVTRLAQGSVNRRGLESLISAGAFDSLLSDDSTVNSWRARLFAGVESALSQAQKIWQDNERGQNALFGNGETLSEFQSAPLPDVAAWTASELSKYEKTAVGFYLSIHPLDNYRQILTDLKIQNLGDYEEIKAGEKITLAGIVSGFQVKYSKKGNRFCVFRLEDQSLGIKCLAWGDVYAKFSESVKNDALLIVEGRIEPNEGQEITLILSGISILDDAIPSNACSLEITLTENNANEQYFEKLFPILSRNKGNCEVYWDVPLNDRISVKMCSDSLKIQGSIEIEENLRRAGCDVKWIL
jgi:DNA polymerase-3 subunit alpha